MPLPPSVRLGAEGRKLDPKLRMVRNGSSTVNAVRAEQCAAVSLAPDSPLLQKVPLQRGEAARALTKEELPAAAARKPLQAVPADVLANVFITTTDASEETKKGFPGETTRRGNVVAATVRLTDVQELAQRERVVYVELGQRLVPPRPTRTPGRGVAPAPTLRRFGDVAAHHGGDKVLIGIVDVEGFDFAHPEFLDAQQQTRWVRIWDQGGDARPTPYDASGAQQRGFKYGAEFRKEHLDAALAASSELHLPPQEIERQSQMVSGSHGTHVASIAAGTNGVCPNAVLAGVLVSLPREDEDRRTSFYDSTRLVHAFEYLIDLADELGLPVSINVSLGTNGHAHDLSPAVNRWIDSALSVPGRSVCVAAGNAGQEAPAFDGDLGYVMGRIHCQGQLASAGLVADIDWMVVGNGRVDLSENELEIWYGSQDRFEVSVMTPDGAWIGPVPPRRYVENQPLDDGSLVSVYNELYNPANGANTISIYLSPFLSEDGVVGVKSGRWLVRLQGIEVRDGRFQGWIERDDPRRLGRMGEREAWRFPSFFSQRSNVDRSSVSSLACAERVISVGNLDDSTETIHVTSSQGPTRDGRFKPEVAAPGTDIPGANGFDEGDPWVSMTGTSMASPFVTGVVGLMLAIQPRLTAAQIAGILQRTSKPLPGGDYGWKHDAGFGRINPEACLEEAAVLNERAPL
jgi:subtilisin family serine protease